MFLRKNIAAISLITFFYVKSLNQESTGINVTNQKGCDKSFDVAVSQEKGK